jgi:hypothetical protein
LDGRLLRHLRLDRIEEADELLMAVAIHVAANDSAIEDVESGEQSRGLVALVVLRDTARLIGKLG